MKLKITCTRRLTFEAGHRVLGHENKCAHLHGHSYKVEITAEANLDALGRVIDFSVLKERIGGWVDRYWDHGFILKSDDPEYEWMTHHQPRPGTDQKVFGLTDNPTAEVLARFLLLQVCPKVLLDTQVTVVAVRVWETENCWADAKLDGR